MLPSDELARVPEAERSELELAVTLWQSHACEALPLSLQLYRGQERAENLSVAGVLDPIAVGLWKRLIDRFEQENPGVREEADARGLLTPDPMPKELFMPLLWALEEMASNQPERKQEGLRLLREGLEQASRCQHLPWGPTLLQAWQKVLEDASADL